VANTVVVQNASPLTCPDAKPGLVLDDFFTRFQNINSDTRLTTTDATGANTQANSTSPPPESNVRCPGPGCGQKSRKFKFHFMLLTRAIRAKLSCLMGKHIESRESINTCAFSKIISPMWSCWYKLLNTPTVDVLQTLLANTKDPHETKLLTNKN